MAAKRKRTRTTKKKKGIIRRLGGGLLKLLLILAIISLLAVACLRWFNPPTSMMMTLERIRAKMDRRSDFHIDYRWVGYENIASALPLAIIASEDQKFPVHRGFDLEAITDAVETRLNGGKLRGASTITQQVAKNLFLWPGKSMFRKGIEAYFTTLIELVISKKRILEIYMNIAEFGEGIFGVEAASQRYFGKPAKRIHLWEAARMAAVLPDPKSMNPGHPSDYVYKRAGWIQRQVDRMGGQRVLDQILKRHS